MIRKREVWRRSYASLVSHPADENHTLGIAVSSTNQWMSHLTHMTLTPTVLMIVFPPLQFCSCNFWLLALNLRPTGTITQTSVVPKH